MGSEPVTSVSEDQLPVVTSPEVLKQALLYKINTRISARGELAVPCVPTMLDHYTEWIELLFRDLGRPLPPDKHNDLRELLAKKLQEGFNQSPSAMLVVQYEPVKSPQTGFACKFVVVSQHLGDQYKGWLDTKEGPLFGSHPDAKLMATAASLGNPSHVKILDVGAGVGRNTLPLAKLGHPVDAIELAPAFADKLRELVVTENLPVNVIQGDVLDPLVRVRPAAYQLAVATEVISHFRNLDQVRLFFAKMCDFLCPGGLLLFSAFLAMDGFEPDQQVREMAELGWSSLFTRSEFVTAMDGLPLKFVSDESVYEYERQRIPPEAWPPTSWYNTWVTGRDVFPIVNGRPPMELRWLLYSRL